MWAQLISAAAIVIPLGLDLLLPLREDNPMTPEKIAIGRQLFFDRRLSRDQSLSCASCHRPNRAFADERAVSVGLFGRVGRRNVPALVNRGYGRLFFWDGRSRSLEDQVMRPIADPNEMGMSVAEAAARVGRTPGEISLALASYVRSILSGNTRLIASSAAIARRSGRTNAACRCSAARGTACHVGPNFTDERTHNTGMAWRTGRLVDEGAGNGAFKTPTLREVARTAPYMHDGSLTTLDAVVDFYDQGGHANPFLDEELRPVRFTPDEKRASCSFFRRSAVTCRKGPERIERY